MNDQTTTLPAPSRPRAGAFCITGEPRHLAELVDTRIGMVRQTRRPAAGTPGWTRDAMRSHPDVQRFKLLDDDGNLCYSGMWIDDVRGAEEVLDMINEWGMNDCGATQLYIRKDLKSEWEGPIFG